MNFLINPYFFLPPTALDLDFTTGTLDPRITFTRASSGTYFDSAGVLQRATYNLRTWSEDITVARVYGAPNSTLTATTTATPLGSAASVFALNAGANTGNAQDGFNFSSVISLANSTQHTQSIYAKSNGSTVLRLRSNVTGNLADFTLTGNGTAPSPSADLQAAAIQNVGNGWYRCSWTFTTTTTAPGNRGDYWSIKTNVADGTSGLLVAGAQLEQASTAGPYYATTASANGAPRFDYNPTTLAARGLLIEEARTNLLTYSEQFDNAVWGKVRGSISNNSIVAPDGNLTGDKLVENTETGAHEVRTPSGISITAGTAYTLSAYLKSAGRTQVLAQFETTNSVWAANSQVLFDITAGTILSNPNSLPATITSIGNGWYRISVTATSAATALGVIGFFAATGGSTSYTGDGTSGIYIWGAQLEAGAFATSYIPTTGAQATRAADSAVMTGTNFSSWYNATEGTLFVDAVGVNNTAGATRRFAEFNDGSANNRQIFGYPATNASRYLVQSSATTQADITAAATAGLAVKMAGAYTANYFQQASNGALGTADTSGTIPAVSQMNLGAAFGDSGSLNTMLNGHIRRIAYYRQRLPNAQLQAITA